MKDIIQEEMSTKKKFQSTGFLFFPLQVLSVVLLVEDLLLAGLVFWLSVILHRSS